MLNQIKLSGFKTFLEPTTLVFDTPLTGIVGPNGCGKSNIVDAIRWVIGESSAKQLRGESLSDVIFSGSATRKPVGKAQVELIFDNRLGRFGDRFSEYSEISIKREMTLEGGSTYFLNQTPCRRRDIMDILLGTGLGPKNYAVVEQGMISHLISANPDELRGYLEEAAQISKYKERRKEAESRLERTRQNINRIKDLLLEVEVQLEKLKHQADIAKIYREWKKRLELISAQLIAIEIVELKKKCKQSESALEDKEKGLAELLKAENQLEQEWEILNQRYHSQTEALSFEQDIYYRFSIEISRLDQALKDARNQDQRLQENLKQFEQNRTHLAHQLRQDQEQIEVLKSQEAQSESVFSLKITQFHISQNDFLEIQKTQQAWQQQWDQFNKIAIQTHQSVEIKKSQLLQLERVIDSLQSRYQRLCKDNEQLQGEISTQEITQWEEELAMLEVKRGAIPIQELEQATYLKSQQQTVLDTQIGEQRVKLQALEAEYTSLKSLQKLAQRKREQPNAVVNWLKQQENSKVTYFSEAIQVKPGWEKAFESVFYSMLDAICVEDVELIASTIALDDGLHLVELNGIEPSFVKDENKLICKLNTSDSFLIQWLSNIYIAKTLDEALKQRSKLKIDESIITQEGIWLGKYWLKTPNIKDERSGVLVRQHRLAILDQEINEHKTLFLEYETQQKTSNEHLFELRKHLEQAQLESRRLIDQKTQIQANINAKKNYLHQMQVRVEQTYKEKELLEKELNQQQVDYVETKKELDLLQLEHSKNQEEESRLKAEKQELNHVFETARMELQGQESKIHQLKLEKESSQKQIQYLSTQILRTEEQIQGINQQFEWVQTQLVEIQAAIPSQMADWTTYHEKQKSSEARLNTIKTEHKEMEQAFNELKDRQQEKKSTLERLRKILERLRIDSESQNVQLLSHEAHMTKLGFEREIVIQSLPKEANKVRWLEQQTELSKNIQELGEVNLAADKEYEELLKRKDYLNEQSEDLLEGLTTLESAIYKIDQETCVQLKTTFEQVNLNFMTFFSKIFEGGTASLELTENNWLSAGVVVKAQPKGKRNTSIHLLSGGEKALTAIALIFALFQLNPAPFCVLDEVDAPLDDHNIGRFCKLMEEMSQTLQFIFISHSKVTLTMARQLVGVTMQEAGVSRIVSVNISDALRIITET